MYVLSCFKHSTEKVDRSDYCCQSTQILQQPHIRLNYRTIFTPRRQGPIYVILLQELLMSQCSLTQICLPASSLLFHVNSMMRVQLHCKNCCIAQSVLLLNMAIINIISNLKTNFCLIYPIFITQTLDLYYICYITTVSVIKEEIPKAGEYTINGIR